MRTRTTEHRIYQWHRGRYPKMWPGGELDPVRMTAKLAEETGEVCGTAIKTEEGRSSRHELAGEIGDVLICLSVLAAHHGWTLEDLRRAKTAQHVPPEEWNS